MILKQSGGINMHNCYFFTDITTECSNLCLLNIKRYNDRRKSDKDLIFIDPSVYELKNSNEYSNIIQLHNVVNKLNDNEYISIDYPCDMNETFSELFIEKSYQNNCKYAHNKQYICTIQFKFMNFESFVYEFQRLESIIDLPEKIIGFGNLCRILRLNKKTKPFCDKLFEFIYDNVKRDKWLHFYGLSANLIEKYIPILLEKFTISIDSTKFTRARRNWFKLENGCACRKHNRNNYFFHYMQELDINNIIF